MTIAEPRAFVEDKLLESEIGRNIPKFARTGASFRQTESGDRAGLGNLNGAISGVSA